MALNPRTPFGAYLLPDSRIAGQALKVIRSVVSIIGREPAPIAVVHLVDDSTIDTAIRRIGTAWIRGGLDPQRLDKPWSGADVDQLFADDPSLLDAIDDIIRTVHRVRFSRPRRTYEQSQAIHRPGAFNLHAR